MKKEKNSPDGDLMTPSDLAQRVNVTIGTLSGWRKSGIGPAYLKFTPGKRGTVRYRVRDVLAWEKTLERHEPIAMENIEAAYGRN